jgi:hypothetical protein
MSVYEPCKAADAVYERGGGYFSITVLSIIL